MATTLKQSETIPASYPTISLYTHFHDVGFEDVYGAASSVPQVMIWQRLESWIAYRWGERVVTWTVEGGDEWQTPLLPATITSVEIWQNDAWAETSLTAGPCGGLQTTTGETYRITATVGTSDDPPDTVQEAFRRLYEFSRGIAEQFKEEASVYEGHDQKRVAGFAAKALQLSGAADLLRPYRRPGNVAI